jgi:hypothetical protein
MAPGDHAFGAYLLDGVGNVGVGERHLLEGSSEGSTETLACVSTSVKTDLESTMPARSRISGAN